MICPHCDSLLGDAPHLAGQIVACPSCGRHFPLPPLPAPASLPPPVPPTAVVLTQAVHQRPTMNWPKVIRWAMLGVTLAWLSAMILLFALSLFAHFGNSDITRFGDYVVDYRTGDTQTEDEWIASGLLGAATLGVCCPAVPYAIAMTVLGVALLAAKKD